jgi:lia operon protein LiaI
MKKFGLLLSGGIAALILLASVGPIIGLVISLAILYYAFKKVLAADSTGSKFGWGIIALIGLASAAHNAPAILGVAAAYVLYLIYKKWTNSRETVKEESDPFINFEKQWNDLKNS